MQNKKALPVIGSHALAAVLYECPEAILEIWHGGSSQQQHAGLLARARDMGLAVKQVRPATLSGVDKAHRGLLGWCRPPPIRTFNWLLETVSGGLLLALDRLTDAHNFGACLRSAEAAAAAAVLVAEKHSAGLSAGAAKSSSGALFRVPLVACPSLSRAIATLNQQGWRTLALSEHAGQSLYAYRPGKKELLVVGNEQQGIQPQVEKACLQRLTIPTRGKNASLNVSVACGLSVLWLAGHMPGDR